jgi:hypothetical protein
MSTRSGHLILLTGDLDAGEGIEAAVSRDPRPVRIHRMANAIRGYLQARTSTERSCRCGCPAKARAFRSGANLAPDAVRRCGWEGFLAAEVG